MKHLVVLLLVAIISLSQCFSQKFINLKTYNVDSLLLILPDQRAEERVNTLNRLASSIFFEEIDLGEQYTAEALNMAQELNYEEGMADAYLNFGYINYYQGNYQDALKNGFDAQRIYEKLDKKNMVAFLYHFIATLHLRVKNFEKTIECCNISLDKLRELLEGGGTVGSARDTIGLFPTIYLTYQYMGMFEKSIGIALKLVDVGTKNNLGMSEMMLTTFKIGQNYLLIGETDKAKVYFNKALAYPDANQDIQALKYRPITWLGILYSQIGEIDTAKFYLKKAYEWYNKTGFLYWSLKVSNDLGSIYYKNNDLNTAENHYQQSERIFNEIMTKNSVFRYDSLKYIVSFGLELYFPMPHRQWNEMMWTEVQSMYYKLYQISEAKKRKGEALKYYISYDEAKDTLNKLQRNREIIQIQTRYESERKDQEIGSLSLENNLIKQTIRTQYWAGAAIGVGLLSLVLISIVLYKSRQKQKKVNIWLEEKVQERTLQLEEAKTNLENAFNELQSLDIAKNSFLKLISHEIRTPLNGIVGAVHFLKDGLKKDTELGEFVDMLDQSVDRLESFSTTALIITQLQAHYQLNKENLMVKDLVTECITDKKTKAEQKGVTINSVTTDDTLNFHVDKILTKRMISSIIDNAIKYSPENEEVRINSSKENNKIIITFTDKSAGFTEEAMKNLFQPFGLGEEHYDKNTGLSLKAAKLIIEAHGGEIEVKNLVDNGAFVRLVFPS